ncbi:hypothetical protein MNEG_10495, partial [Monoraphidium neglectum]
MEKILAPLHAAIGTICQPGPHAGAPPEIAIHALRASVATLAAAHPQLQQAEAEG